jgi:hypothetical protein
MFRINRMMDQKPMVFYLRMKGMVLDGVHDDLVRKLRKDIVVYSMVTKYARSAQFSGRKEATTPETPDVERSPVDEAILTALAEFPFPFSFVRELSWRICLPRSTVHRHWHWHLTQSLRFASRCDTSNGSPTFDGGTEADSGPDDNRTIAGPLGAKQNTRQWHDIVTLDES